MSVMVRAWLLLLLCVAPMCPASPPDEGAASASDPGLFAGLPLPDVGADFIPFADAWPVRWGAEGKKIQGVIVDIEGPTLRPQGRRHGMMIVTMADSNPIVRALCALDGGEGSLRVNLEGEGAYTFALPPVPQGEKVPSKEINRAAMTFVYASATPNAENPRDVMVERTWFLLHDPVSPRRGEPAPAIRGLVLLMPGMFGTPEGTLSLLTTRLRREGWSVLRMQSQPSRFTERTDFEIDLAKDLAESAARIAATVGDRAAECALAAEGALAHVEAKRPEFTSLPRVVIGFSGGAMTLPTVVARDPQRYTAAVLVGGGADFWLIISRSNYADWIDAAHVAWIGGNPTPEHEKRLNDLYLEKSPMDSFHTASAMRGKKMLVIQGTIDLAVPSPLGDVLWERLGKPERWTFDVGHELLFMQLPSQYDRMMTWLDAAAPAPAPAP